MLKDVTASAYARLIYRDGDDVTHLGRHHARGAKMP